MSKSQYEFVTITPPLQVGTRIHYDECTDSVYFVDLPTCEVYRYHISSGKTFKAKVGCGNLAFMFPVEGSNAKFIAGIDRKIVFVNWDGSSEEVTSIEDIVEVDNEPGKCDNRLNGAKVDPWGRLWAGTMGPEGDDGEIKPAMGTLYCLEKGKLTNIKCRIGISNGLAWDTKKMKMYYCDTLEPSIFQYDIAKNGKISNEQIIFDYNKNKLKGKPDGLTIDKCGDLYLCSIFGSTICKIDPCKGVIKETITFPTPQVTAVTFGGKNLNDLYVTTAQIPVKGVKPSCPAGSTYKIRVKSTGFNGDRYKP